MRVGRSLVVRGSSSCPRGGGIRTSLALPIQGRKGGKRADQNTQIGERYGQTNPVHHCDDARLDRMLVGEVSSRAQDGVEERKRSELLISFLFGQD